MIRTRNYPFPSTIEVYFDRPMVDNAELRMTSIYRLDHGAYVTGVTVLDAESIRLTVENLFGYSSFELSVIDDGIVSQDGYMLDKSVTMTVTLNDAEEGIYALSAANGRLKSGQKAEKVYSDEEYFYVMTESGLDIVDKNSLFNKGFVLQEGGFTTIFVGGSDD